MITEDLGAFLADFGEEFEFVREIEESSSSSPESSSSSSSSSSSTTSVVTATLIWDAPPFEFNAYDRSFYDEKFYDASGVMSKARALGVESELIAVDINDRITRSGENWYVIGKVPDGTGMMTVGFSHQRVDPA
jgi:hypothetical protein